MYLAVLHVAAISALRQPRMPMPLHMNSIAPSWNLEEILRLPAHGGNHQLIHCSVPVSEQQSAEMRMNRGDQSI